LIFDMDELDRHMSAAIQMDITATPPPEVPKDIVISTIVTHDVLCGRGGETNHHAGNIRYRQLVKLCQPAYIAAKRRDKPKIAQRIVRAVRLLGGRFMKKMAGTSCWQDVGNAKAREKTSQALREGAPELRNGEEAARPKNKRLQANHLPVLLRDAPPACPSSSLGPQVARAPEHTPFRPANHVPVLLRVTPPLGAGPYTAAVHEQHHPHTDKKRRLHDDETSKAPDETSKAVDRTTTPTSFTATVSADDDDGSRSPPTNNPATPARGPRLKLLKQRWKAAGTV
jgi:hypothetical protein